MKKQIVAVLVAVLVAVGMALTAAPAQAAHAHYGETSRDVAAEIGCTRFRGNGGGGAVYRTGVCWLGGKRVNVITFEDVAQQRSWNGLATSLFARNFFWGNGRGAVVVARDGNRPAARAGMRRLPGALVHG